MKLSDMKKDGSLDEKKLNESYESLKDCTPNELMGKLEDEVKRQKQNGTFNFDALMNSIERIRVYLPKESYENMKRIIYQLK